MLARGSFPKAGLMLEFREGPLIRQRSGRFQKGRQANEKPAAQGVWGAKQQMRVRVLGATSLSDLGPVFDCLSSSLLSVTGVGGEPDRIKYLLGFF